MHYKRQTIRLYFHCVEPDGVTLWRAIRLNQSSNHNQENVKVRLHTEIIIGFKLCLLITGLQVSTIAAQIISWI